MNSMSSSELRVLRISKICYFFYYSKTQPFFELCGKMNSLIVGIIVSIGDMTQLKCTTEAKNHLLTYRNGHVYFSRTRKYFIKHF